MLLLLAIALLGLAGPAQAGVEATARPGWAAWRWSSEDGLPNGEVRALALDSNGLAWIATLNGLVRFDGRRFERFAPGTHPGLPSARFIDVLVTDGNHVWAATEGGQLVRGDGRAFEQIDLEALGLGATVRLVEGPDSSWLLGTQGVARIEGAELVPTPIDGDGNAAHEALCLSFLQGRSPILLTARRHLFGYQPEQGRFLPLPPETSAHARLEAPGQRTLDPTCALPTGTSWLTADITAVHVGGPDEEPRPVSRTARRAALLQGPSGTPYVISHADGVLGWTGTELVPVDPREETVTEGWWTWEGVLYHQRLPVFEGRSSLSLLAQDADGGIWLADQTDGLVHLVQGPVSSMHGDEHGALGAVDAVLVDRRGALWIAGRGGLRHWRDEQRVEVLGPDGAALRDTHALLEGRDGTIYVAGLGGGCVAREVPRTDTVRCEADPSRPLPTGVQAMLEGPDGSLWLGSMQLDRSWPDGRLEHVVGAGDTPFRALAALADGTVLAAAIGKGLYRVRDGEILLRDGRTVGEDALRVVRGVLVDERGDAWLATEGFGVCRLELSKPLPFADVPLRCVGEAQGLKDGFINSLASDARGRLWLSTNSGLQAVRWDALLDVVEGRASQLPVLFVGRTEGMVETETNGTGKPSVARAADGSLWYPTMDGVARLDPQAVAFPEPPAVVVRGLRSSARELPLEATGAAPPAPDSPGSDSPGSDSPVLVLQPDERELTVEWTAAAFTRSDSLRFRYRLEGLDTDWRGPTAERSATWTNLPPGRYTLQLQSGWGGRWRVASSVAAVVVPPTFRETPWFALSLLLLTAGFAAGLLAVRSRRARQRERQLRDAVEGATAELATRNRRLVEQSAELTAQRQALTEQAATLEEQNTRIAAQADELSERNARIAAQAERLGQLDQVRTRFVANISHELRTPLTLIQGTLDDVTDQATGPLQRPLQVARRNTHRLSELVEQLLDVARLDADGVPLRARRLDLHSFLQHLAERFETAAQARGVELRLDLDPSIEVWGDPDLLEKVFVNLLANGLDYCPQGGWLRVTLGRSGSPDQGQAVVRVVDTGPGVPPEQRGRLFDRFFQADDSDRRHRGGAGIGLSLAQDFVQLHGGELAVVDPDEPGGGACFEVRLPLGAAHLSVEEISLEPELRDQGPMALPSAEDEPPPSTSPRLTWPELDPDGLPVLLLAEDHADMRDFMAQHLSAAFQVLPVADGQAALEALHAGLRPALVVSDVMMPRLDGLALCRAIRGAPHLAELPILLVSAKATEADQVAGLSLANDYLTKPFRTSEMVQRARALVPEPPPAAAPSTTAGLEAAAAPEQQESSAFVDKLQAIAAEHLGDSGFGAGQLARKAAYSPRQLLRRIQQATGLSTAAWLREQRLQHARQLMRSGQVETVSEAAAAVGMSRAYLSRVYRDWAGHPASNELQAR